MHAWTRFIFSPLNFVRFCYFEDDVEKDDIYVMCPFPSIWNCGVVHPHGLDPLSGDVKTLQGLCRSLEILVYMRSESSRLGMSSGNYIYLLS